MIWLWRKFTLWDYGTDEDPPDIPMIGLLGASVLACAIWAAWTVAVWIMEN